MDDHLEPLILDLLDWVGTDARPYDEVMDAWRTSCPRLPVWEEANGRGYLAGRHVPGAGRLVVVTPSGVEYLRAHRTPVPATT